MNSLKEALSKSKSKLGIQELFPLLDALANAPRWVWDVSLIPSYRDGCNLTMQTPEFRKSQLVTWEELAEIILPNSPDPSLLMHNIIELMGNHESFMQILTQSYIEDSKKEEYAFVRSLKFYQTEPVNDRNIQAVREDFLRLYANTPLMPDMMPISVPYYDHVPLGEYAKKVLAYTRNLNVNSATLSCMDRYYSPCLLAQPKVGIAALLDDQGTVYARTLTLTDGNSQFYVNVYAARRPQSLYPSDPRRNKLSKELKVCLKKLGYQFLNREITDFNLVIPKVDLIYPIANNICISLPACPYIDNISMYDSVLLVPIDSNYYKLESQLNPKYSMPWQRRGCLYSSTQGYALPPYLSQQGLKLTMASLMHRISALKINDNSADSYVIPLEHLTEVAELTYVVDNIDRYPQYAYKNSVSMAFPYLETEGAFVNDTNLNDISYEL